MTTPSPKPQQEPQHEGAAEPRLPKYEAGGIHNRVKRGMDPSKPQQKWSFLDWLLRR